MGNGIHLTIDNRPVTAPAGATVLEAARATGVEIPTLCHLETFPPYTACMICVVWDGSRKALIPSCSTPAAEGMAIDTRCERVRDARRAVLELLLSEHVGDCEAPCRLACPARMDVPAMIRRIRAGDARGAHAVAKEHIPLPATLGRVCSAPCEKACRRALVDEPVAICLLKRFAADRDIAGGSPWLPECAPDTGRSVAIVGAGPAGLSAAWFLRRAGQRCTVLDGAEQGGGSLRLHVPESVLPRRVLDAEIGEIGRIGVEWRWGVELGRDISLARLRREFDAVVLAFGSRSPERMAAMGLPADGKGMTVGRHTPGVERDGVFAAGACVHATRMAVRAVVDGERVAAAVTAWLRGCAEGGVARRFNSRMAAPTEAELREFLREADPACRRAADTEEGFSESAALAEAARCLRCDCRDKESCRLRALAEEYGARQNRYPIDERPAMIKVMLHRGAILEPGKCIQCGRCVRIGERAGARDGLTFMGRGLDVRIGVPFGGNLASVPVEVQRACVDACPTGALAWREEGSENVRHPVPPPATSGTARRPAR